jgi:cysteine protease ATG4
VGLFDQTRTTKSHSYRNYRYIYLTLLQACFELEQCAGVIGGRPNHALYFLGYTCDDLICLDPHVTQTAASVGSKSSPDEEEADSTYHTDQFYRWHMDQLDPSISLVNYYF